MRGEKEERKKERRKEGKKVRYITDDDVLLL